MSLSLYIVTQTGFKRLHRHENAADGNSQHPCSLAVSVFMCALCMHCITQAFQHSLDLIPQTKKAEPFVESLNQGP